MTPSRPNIFKLIIARLWVLITVGLLVMLIVEWGTGWMEIDSVGQYFILIAIMSGLLGILIELPEIKALTIADDKIIVKNLLTGKSKEIRFTVVDEFKILVHMQRYSGLKLTLILSNQGNPHEPISLDYVDNPHEIIHALEKRLPNTTIDEYGFLKFVRQRK
jgi:hypothetical protein